MAKQPGPPERTVQPTLSMEIFRQQLLKLLDQHSGHLDSTVMLGVAAYAVGQMMALQDAKKYKPQQIIELVQNNIELGNKDAVRAVAEGRM